MPAYNLRRFSHPDTLKKISPDLLLQLLSHHRDFFDRRGVPLPAAADADMLNYEGLARIFMNPSDDTPPELAEVLYYIHEMATPDGMDALLDAALKKGLDLGKYKYASPGDVAILVWLLDKKLVVQKHAERIVAKRRAFEYYQTGHCPAPPLPSITDEMMSGLETYLDDWFFNKKRGRGTKIIVCSSSETLVWFLIRHSGTFAEPTLNRKCTLT